MIKMWCNHVGCQAYQNGEVEYTGKKTYVMDKEGHLVLSNIPKCPLCGHQYFYREILPAELPNISIGEFKMMAPGQKQEMLKKRYLDIGKKEDVQGKIKEKREKTIKKFFGE